MRKEEIVAFLEENQEIAKSIEKMANRYSLTDFVKLDQECKDYFENEENEKIGKITGCLYNEREDRLLLESNLITPRLKEEYLKFLCNLIGEKNEDNKLLYIVAYHYLTMYKQIGYELVEANNSPSRFLGNKISRLGKINLDDYQKLFNESCSNIIPCIGINDLEYYHEIYTQLDWYDSSTKYFSLINSLLKFGCMVSKHDFDKEFKRRLDLFVFRYKAIYTTEFLFTYMDKESKEKVINSLINL